ncbi:hypothetical protein D1641_08050 [Colidextribacter sp. OB.20]|uniref:hypothetical protein n=1 Tax=Colidextribacter sp. OB.20 TaxID=2304568 RepID=UPI001370173A|nr:hypothetical protein [Colidextribacter sp. OB.20]NBI09970.1 hypothetical protein [Colidextribacter sp. OB.20]
MSMSLIQKKYEAILSKFKEEISSNPDADFTPYTQELMATLAVELRAREQLGEKRTLNLLLLGLYKGNPKKLKRDITKVMMTGAPKAVTSQTAPSPGLLFLNLCRELSLHTKEDFADILAVCDQIEDAYRTYSP